MEQELANFVNPERKTMSMEASYRVLLEGRLSKEEVLEVYEYFKSKNIGVKATPLLKEAKRQNILPESLEKELSRLQANMDEEIAFLERQFSEGDAELKKIFRLFSLYIIEWR
jgi:hypothetical protein